MVHEGCGAGICKAQNNLGVMYRHGEGVPQDDKEAVKWYTKAAEQGEAKAQNNLGVMYRHGVPQDGVPQDDKETPSTALLTSTSGCTKAAEQGDTIAQQTLGVMYYWGEGVPKDDKEAVKWYRKAAEQGHATAQLTLGVMYHYGQGVPKSYINAYAWYNLAASEELTIAITNLNQLEEQMTTQQLTEAKELSKTLVKK